jgi:histidinol dehydrogenase
VNSIRFIVLSKLTKRELETLLIRAEADLTPFLEGARPIIHAVRDRGDEALVEYAKKFDGADLTPKALKCSDAEFEAAENILSDEVKEAIRFAAENIRRFHETQLPEPLKMVEIQPGVMGGEKTMSIPSVACYVPRGKGSFPSVALMTTIPAVVAGVETILLITPPGPDGSVDAGTLYAAKVAGVTHVFKCGGVQGIAAVAYGTETVSKVAKVVGPGSPWVVAAKRLLSDLIDPGLPAGPSESIVLADETANPELAALDLIVESEHGPDSSAFLVTHSREVAEMAHQTIPRFLGNLSKTRREYITTVLGGAHGGILLAGSMDEAIAFVNDFAPEHLEILSEDPHQYLEKIRNAGEILLGSHTPFTLGNYLIGPNAVLPTGGWAKTFSPLSVHDFLKRSSIAYVSETAYPELAEKAHTLARYEGFDAHAQAVSEIREDLLKK